MAKESTARLFLVTGILAVVCSLVVSLAAVGLGPKQDANRERDRKKNILQVAGLYDPAGSIDDAFADIKTVLIDLETGEEVAEDAVPDGYDPRLALSSPDLSTAVASDADIAGISRREKYTYVYMVTDGEEVSQLILPVRGRGLFSTLWGFMAIDSDLRTVRGITFYEHGETAGLGAEVENPNWKSVWPGKLVFDDDGQVALHVIKGPVNPQSANAAYEIDGLSGATMTANGVTRLVQYWFGDAGYGPYLERLRQEGISVES